jgi:hypothetical protein
LATLEVDQRHAVPLSKLMHPLHESVMQRPEQGRRRDRFSQVLVQKAPQPAGRLKHWHIAVEVQAIDAGDRQRHVIADNAVEV